MSLNEVNLLGVPTILSYSHCASSHPPTRRRWEFCCRRNSSDMTRFPFPLFFLLDLRMLTSGAALISTFPPPPAPRVTFSPERHGSPPTFLSFPLSSPSRKSLIFFYPLFRSMPFPLRGDLLSPHPLLPLCSWILDVVILEPHLFRASLQPPRCR